MTTASEAPRRDEADLAALALAIAPAVMLLSSTTAVDGPGLSTSGAVTAMNPHTGSANETRAPLFGKRTKVAF